MFKNYIQMTSLTTEAANDFFADRIFGDNYNSDTSFLAILRALLDPRIPEGERLRFVVETETRNADFFASKSARDAFSEVFESPYINGGHTFYLHVMNGRHEANEATINFVEESFLPLHEGWQRLENVTSLFAGSNFKVICYINPGIKSTAVFASDVTIKKYHLLQCAILGMIPWYFDPSQNVTDVERKLIYSTLSDKEESYNQYLECIDIISKKYDFESVRLDRLLNGFEHKFDEIEIAKAKRDADSRNNRIAELNHDITELIKELSSINARILGLELRMNEEADEFTILDYFKSHKNMYLESISGSKLYFAVRGNLSYFDEGMYKRMMNNDNCYAYRYLDRDISKEQARKLFDAIFVDQSIKLKVCAAYCLDVSGSINALSVHTYTGDFEQCYPNPHIQNHACLGNYRTTLNEYLRNGNFIMCLEQCVASCVSLNFGDPTVMSEFFRELCGRKSGKYYELPDGKRVNILEAIKWLESQENADEKMESEE